MTQPARLGPQQSQVVAALQAMFEDVKRRIEVNDEGFDTMLEHTLAAWGPWRARAPVPVDDSDPHAGVKRQWLTICLFQHNPYDDDAQEGPEYLVGDVRAFVMTPDGGFVYTMNPRYPQKIREIGSGEHFVRELRDEFESLKYVLEDGEGPDPKTCPACRAIMPAMLAVEDEEEAREAAFCGACGATLSEVVS